MNLFTLFGKLSLDSKDFINGVDQAVQSITSFSDLTNTVMQAVSGDVLDAGTAFKTVWEGAKNLSSFAQGIGAAAGATAIDVITGVGSAAKDLDGQLMSVVDTAGNLVVSALNSAASAAGAFVQSVVREGSEFDAAMGQVSATSLKARDDFDATQVKTDGFFGNLRDLAKKYGAETKFTASQAGQALNYMALAGYDAQQSADMLGTVLNLAAAGALDLGYASDVVTDAQTALAVKMEDMTEFVDEMAKTASSTNTSVGQLGEAMLTLGATGRMAKGGFTELNTVLGVLANNGIKGSQGGNMLRRVLVNISAPTGEAAQALDKLGVKIYDNNDKMKALPQIFQEMGAALDELGDKERNETINAIFGQYSLAGANALLGTTAEQWKDIESKISDANGAAKEMANIQKETLPGALTTLQSAISGVKINIFDMFSADLKNFVEMFSDTLSGVAEEISNGNFEAAFSELGSGIADIITKAIQWVIDNDDTINDIINGIVTFGSKVGTALFDNGGELLQQILGHLLYFAQLTIQQFAEFLGKEENVQKITETISHLFLQIQTFLTNSRDDLETIFSTLFDIAIQFIDDVFVLKRETLYAVLFAKAKEVLKDLIDNIHKYLNSEESQTIIRNIIDFIGNLSKMLIDAAVEMFPNVMAFISSLADMILPSLAAWIRNPVNQEKISGMIESFFTTINEIIDNHKTEIITILGFIYENVTKVMLSVMGLKAKWAINNFFYGAGYVLKGVFGKIKQWLRGPSLWALEITDVLHDVFSDGLSGFVEKIKTKLKNVGASLLEGILKGFREGQEEPLHRSVFSDSAKVILDLLNDAYDIHSPSKLTEKVGDFLGQGIGVGFNKRMEKVTAEMRSTLPKSFDIQAQTSYSGNQRRNQIRSVVLNIDNFNNYTNEDINSLGERISSMLRNEIYTEKAATI